MHCINRREKEEFANAIDDLFLKIEAIKINNFNYHTPTFKKEIKKQWLISLLEENMRTNEKLNFDLGLKNLRTDLSPYFPTAAQFIDLCKFKINKSELQRCLTRFNQNLYADTLAAKKTEDLCGYDCKRLQKDKSNALYIKTFKQIESELQENPKIPPPKQQRLLAMTDEEKEKQREKQKEINKRWIKKINEILNDNKK